MQLQNGISYRHVVNRSNMGMVADLHCHNGMELIYVRSGSLAHVVEGRRYSIAPNDLVVVHPSSYHYLEQLSDEPYERYNIIFDPRVLPVDISAIPRDLEVVTLKSGSIAAELFAKMDYYCSRLDSGTFSVLLSQLLGELFINLQLDTGEKRREDTSVYPVVAEALAYINEHLFTIKDVEEVAEALYISPSYLFCLFRNTLHQTPKRYIRDKRLLAAQRRLRRGMSPTAACKECGFKEYATFFRSYKAFFGYPPSQEQGSLDTTPL